MIYGVQYTSTASGEVFKRVECEECGHRYGYRMKRAMASSHSSYFGFGGRQAQRNASRDADEGLARRLEEECDPVPCPKCGWYQDEMVDEYRRRAYKGLVIGAWVAVVCLFFGGGGIAFVLSRVIGGPKGMPIATSVVGALFMLAVGAAIGITVFRSTPAARLDPNRDFPEDERIDLGRDLAMTRKQYERVFGGEDRKRKRMPARDPSPDQWD